MEKNNQFMINLGLFIFGIATVFSGMLIQVNYHMGNPVNHAVEKFVLGMDYHGWTTMHKISIVTLALLMIHHGYQHWNWYKAVMIKKLFKKNQQVLILSLLFILVAITGFTPWCIDLLQGDETHRKFFIEIHDKLTLVLAIYLILHIIKRLRWYFSTFEKINNRHSTKSQL